MSRVLKTGSNQITCTYAAHCANVAAGRAWAKGVDVVKYRSQIDRITAHSAGRVIKAIDYLGGTNGIADDEGMGYGNYVMLLHNDNYVTLYAHMESVYVREGQTVALGDELGLMGNTGNSFGAHLHFEVRRYKAAPADNLHDTAEFEWLDPTDCLDAALPGCASSASPSAADSDVTAVSGVAAASGNGGLNTVKAGTKVELADFPVYNSESGKSIGTRSGTYFVWSEEVRNGRVRMTNSAARVGVKGQVSFWAALADIGAVTVFESKTETITPPPTPVTEKTYTVKAGDSLWSIAAKQLGNGGRYKEIKNLNRLKDDVIYKGQLLRLPE